MAKKAVKKKAPAKKAAVKKKAPAKKAPAKKAPAKKTPAKKAPAKKVAVKKKAPAKKAAVKKKAPAKKAAGKKVAEKKASEKKVAAKKERSSIAPMGRKSSGRGRRTPTKKRPRVPSLVEEPREILTAKRSKDSKLPTSFLKKQKQRLLELHDSLINQMSGVARDTLRKPGEGGDASAFGMHQADAGSDAYDRDFALNLLSQEQDALHEIEEALTRIDNGTYGVCEGSGEPIPRARLEAMPFARFTVVYQEKLDEEASHGQLRSPVTSLFGLESPVASPSDSSDD